MGFTKITLTLAILCFVLVRELDINGGNRHIIVAEAEQQIDCEGKCNYRCSKTSRHKICIRACNTCCHRCNCVPPGTSGNEDVCPCYANQTTHGGKHKCP